MTDSKKTIQDILRDDAFWTRVGEKAVAQREAELAEHRAFLESPTCQRMVEILLAEESNLQFDSESFVYNPEYVKKCMGWQEFDDETILLFMRAVGDSRLDTVVDKRAIDDAITFTHKGVDVTILSGQGTVFLFSNASTVRKRRIAQGLLPPAMTAAELQLKLKFAAGREGEPEQAALVELRNALNQFLGGGVESLFTYSIPSQFATEGSMPTVAMNMADMTLRDVQ
jgi:hypothetical protein